MVNQDLEPRLHKAAVKTAQQEHILKAAARQGGGAKAGCVTNRQASAPERIGQAIVKEGGSLWDGTPAAQVLREGRDQLDPAYLTAADGTVVASLYRRIRELFQFGRGLALIGHRVP